MINATNRIPHRIGLIAAVVAASLGAAGPVCAANHGRTSVPGMTYVSLQNLPDFAGSWVPLVPPFTPPDPNLPPPGTPPKELRPEVAARYAEDVKKYLASGSLDRGDCLPVRFSGQMPLGAAGSLEILYTPGRVTIATEGGVVRRIYLRNTPPPLALDESRGGTSIAHWEGQTLVVKTTGLSREAWLVPGLPIGRGASATERISLRDPDNLQVESVLIAPEILATPLKSTALYRRAPGRFFTEFDTCMQSDRSYDDTSKTERFDATPPADLPPPPPR